MPDRAELTGVERSHAGREVFAGHRRWGTLFASGALAALAVAGCGWSAPPAPEQPIAFDHSVHAESDIECTRCHQGAETQDQAGLPAMATCATCHRREATDHPAVMAFMEQYASGQGEPMVWRKVNVMPTSAMVHFKHKPHIRADVDCATCHGDVAQMTVAQQVINTANMGWCLDCHRESGASIDCLTCHH